MVGEPSGPLVVGGLEKGEIFYSSNARNKHTVFVLCHVLIIAFSHNGVATLQHGFHILYTAVSVTPLLACLIVKI